MTVVASYSSLLPRVQTSNAKRHRDFHSSHLFDDAPLELPAVHDRSQITGTQSVPLVSNIKLLQISEPLAATLTKRQQDFLEMKPLEKESMQKESQEIPVLLSQNFSQSNNVAKIQRSKIPVTSSHKRWWVSDSEREAERQMLMQKLRSIEERPNSSSSEMNNNVDPKLKQETADPIPASEAIKPTEETSKPTDSQKETNIQKKTFSNIKSAIPSLLKRKWEIPKLDNQELVVEGSLNSLSENGAKVSQNLSLGASFQQLEDLANEFIQQNEKNDTEITEILGCYNEDLNVTPNVKTHRSESRMSEAFYVPIEGQQRSRSSRKQWVNSKSDIELTPISMSAQSNIMDGETLNQSLPTTKRKKIKTISSTTQTDTSEVDKLKVGPAMLSLLVLKWLRDNKFHSSANALCKEANIGVYKENHEQLSSYLNAHQFEKAIALVNSVYVKVLSSKKLKMKEGASVNRLKSAFNDLLYILQKYFYIDCILSSRRDVAWSLVPGLFSFSKSESECSEKDVKRHEWYYNDACLLESLLQKELTTEGSAILNNWNWKHEFDEFWDSSSKTFNHRMIKRCYKLFKEARDEKLPELQLPDIPPLPLFSHVIADYFIDRTPVMDLDKLIEIAGGLISNRNELIHELIPFGVSTDFLNSKNKWITWPIWNSNLLQSTVQEKIPATPLFSRAENILNEKHKSHNNKTQFSLVKRSALASPVQAVDVISTSSKSYFACACENKTISILSLPSLDLASKLNYSFPCKGFVSLAFHPKNSRFLLSVDTERNICWWDWKEKKILQMWKKAHSHPVNQIIFDCESTIERAITCSADHSIKFWSLTQSHSHVASVHSNAPFTALAIAGEDNNQILLGAQNKGIIRLYRLKTLTPIRQIQISQFMDSAISYISVNPSNHNNILISPEKQDMVAIYDIKKMKVLKTFTARGYVSSKVNPARFSSDGQYVYADCVPTTDASELTKIYIWKKDNAHLVHMGSLGVRIRIENKDAGLIHSRWFGNYVISGTNEGQLKIFKGVDSTA